MNLCLSVLDSGSFQAHTHDRNTYKVISTSLTYLTHGFPFPNLFGIFNAKKTPNVFPKDQTFFSHSHGQIFHYLYSGVHQKRKNNTNIKNVTINKGMKYKNKRETQNGKYIIAHE